MKETSPDDCWGHGQRVTFAEVGEDGSVAWGTPKLMEVIGAGAKLVCCRMYDVGKHN